MKSSFSRMATGGLVAAAMLIAASVQAAVNQATVSRVSGTAEYAASEGSDWQSLSVGRALGPGAVVRTGVNSQVDLFLRENGPTVRLIENTTLKLDALDFERTGVDLIINTQLDLKQGTILGHVYKMAEASKYEVKTPYTVCGIRGTEYMISADGVHHVITGSLEVAYRNPSNQQISSFTVNEGQTFTPPVDPATQPPIVAPTPPAVQQQINNVRPPVVPPPAPPITVVPEPVQFVSPGTGPR